MKVKVQGKVYNMIQINDNNMLHFFYKISEP